MNKIKYFPLGIAKGGAFCNRISERKQLAANIERGKHTIITSPRRYGKSSLALFTLDELKVPYERIDLFVAVNAKTIEEQILVGVKNLINKVSSVPEQAVIYIKNYIKNLKSKWIVGTDGVNIELIPEKSESSAIIIKEALQMLENILRKKKTPSIFFIDEFQEIGVLANHNGIEGSIRHVAQESEYLNFIFSGSNRHILANMFDDRSSPLYMLCDRITIDRISRDDYCSYINRIAEKTWNKSLDQSSMDEIFNKTELHPYYMNVLCDKLWVYCEKTPPTDKKVDNAWNDYVLQEKSRVAKEISTLNTTQKKLLIAISQGISSDLTGKESLQKFNLSSAAITKSLKMLENQDYIFRNKDNKYQLIDPLIKTSLTCFYPSIF